MDRQTRKDLKTDKFAAEVVDVYSWTTHHKAMVIRYGSIAVAVLVIIFGVFMYQNSQAETRQKALADALHAADATVGPTAAPPGAMHFASEQEKQQAIAKAYTDLAAKYSGTDEGSIAEMALASEAVDKGNMAEAEKRYKSVVDKGPKPYAALARIALGQVYSSEGKYAEAQKVLQEAVANPTSTVSKDQATIALARVIAMNNPAEALKMLGPLRTSTRVPISGEAGKAYSEIDTAGKK